MTRRIPLADSMRERVVLSILRHNRAECDPATEALITLESLLQTTSDHEKETTRLPSLRKGRIVESWSHLVAPIAQPALARTAISDGMSKPSQTCSPNCGSDLAVPMVCARFGAETRRSARRARVVGPAQPFAGIDKAWFPSFFCQILPDLATSRRDVWDAHCDSCSFAGVDIADAD